MRMIHDEESAEAWLVRHRWPDGISCPECECVDVLERASRRPQPYHCRDCRTYFSVRTGTLMHGSKLEHRVWVAPIYMMTTGLKGTSSMKLHRELGVS